MEAIRSIWLFFQDQILGMKWLNALIGKGLKTLGLDLDGIAGGAIFRRSAPEKFWDVLAVLLRIQRQHCWKRSPHSVPAHLFLFLWALQVRAYLSGSRSRFLFRPPWLIWVRLYC